ncbi:MAG: Gfo/Idh/MocA family protein [Verrucomicrobiales bacterium]
MIKLAIIGAGGMASWHAQNFSKMKGVKLEAVVDVDQTRAQAMADKHNVKQVYTDVDRMLAESGVDAVTNVTPDQFHAPLTLKAIKAGKHVLCEKPLATNHADAAKMVRAAQKAGVINMVNFSYRDAPAIQLARKLVASGKLGDIVHVEASYLQSWLSSKVWGDWRTNPTWLWRLSSAHGSRGVLGDVGVHILDFASYPVGDIRSVQCRLATYSQHKGTKMGDYVLDANDTAIITVEFENGALGTIHTTRWATGHKNLLTLRLFGTKGALRVDLDKSRDSIEVCLGADVDKAEWRSMQAPAWPSVYQQFIKSIKTGVNAQPDFATGAKIQKALDACFLSDAEKSPVKLR